MSTLNFVILGIDNEEDIIRTMINGKVYNYFPVTMEATPLLEKVRGIYKHCPGRALAFLKKNTELVKEA